jgi:hypothetical protein
MANWSDSVCAKSTAVRSRVQRPGWGWSLRKHRKEREQLQAHSRGAESGERRHRPAAPRRTEAQRVQDWRPAERRWDAGECR